MASNMCPQSYAMEDPPDITTACEQDGEFTEVVNLLSMNYLSKKGRSLSWRDISVWEHKLVQPQVSTTIS